MAIITKSIGTTGRDYTTVTLWEADHTALGANDLIGEMFNDSIFNEFVTFNDATPTSVKLTSGAGEEHDGIALSGARFQLSSGGLSILNIRISNFTLNLVEINANNQSINQAIRCLEVATSNIDVTSNLIYDLNAGTSGIGFRCDSVTTSIIADNFVYRIRAGLGAGGLFVGAGVTNLDLNNNTVLHTETASGSSNAINIDINGSDVASVTMKNNLCLDPIGASSGLIDDYRSTSNAAVDFNGASDSSAQGGNSLNNLTSGDEIISTTVGSENLHLLKTASVIGKGTDLGTTGNNDIHNFDRNGLLTLVWDMGGHQRLITATIGTTGRDFTTMTLWEAGLSSTSGATTSDSVSEVYNDTAFDENITINNTTPASRILTVPENQRHDGIAGTGVRNVATTHRTLDVSVVTTVEWIEFDSNDKGSFSPTIHMNASGSVFRNCIIHGMVHSTGSSTSAQVNLPKTVDCLNNIIYHASNTGNLGKTKGIESTAGAAEVINIINCTVHDHQSSTSGDDGIKILDTDSNKTIKNCISTDTTTKDYDIGVGPTESNNISSDVTSNGTDSIDNVTSASLFVSTTLGSENLHLKAGADAISAGTDLGITNGVNTDINGTNRDIFAAIIWDIGAHQIKKVASIGTNSRDYTTATLWEADHGDSNIYADGDIVVGEMYKDSTFTDAVQLASATFTFDSVKLKPATGERHDGIAGTGVLFVHNGGSGILVGTYTATTNVTIEGIEIEANGTSMLYGVKFSGTRDKGIVSGCLIHGINNSSINDTSAVFVQSTNTIILNTIMYNIKKSNASGKVKGIDADFVVNNIITSYNNTIVNIGITNAGSAAKASGIETKDTAATQIVRNTICMDITNAGSGTAKDFEINSPSNAIYDHNLSSDTTASGTGSLINKTSSDQFISATGGSENFHLLDTSVAIGAGVDLGTTPTGVNIDIDGTVRGSIWDIGADENPLDSPLGGNLVSNERGILRGVQRGVLMGAI